MASFAKSPQKLQALPGFVALALDSVNCDRLHVFSFFAFGFGICAINRSELSYGLRRDVTSSISFIVCSYSIQTRTVVLESLKLPSFVLSGTRAWERCQLVRSQCPCAN